MGWWKKHNPDPLDQRSKALKSQLSSLEDEIRRLQSQVEQPASQPKHRSTVRPQSPTSQRPITAIPKEPIFEPVDHWQHKAESPSTAPHFNDLGVRKYDLLANWRRFKAHFRGPSSNNPKLVSYLAAGSINGLRPLRYEKRVARNRFIFLSVFFVLILWGILAMIFNQR